MEDDDAADEIALVEDDEEENDFRSHKRKRNTSNSEQMKIFEVITKTLKENNSKKIEMFQKMQADSQSELELFFSCICKTVEKFSPIEQARVKMQISKTVSQCELARLETYNYAVPMANSTILGTQTYPENTIYTTDNTSLYDL